MAAIKLDHFVKSLFIVVYVVSFTGCLTKGKAVDKNVQGTTRPPTIISVYKASGKIQARDATNRKASTTSVPRTTAPTKVLVLALFVSPWGRRWLLQLYCINSVDCVAVRLCQRQLSDSSLVAYQCTIWKLF